MQGVTELLSHLRSLGVRITVESGRLNCNAPKGVLTTELQASIRENKFQLISLLSGTYQNTSLDATAVPNVESIPTVLPNEARQGLLALGCGDNLAYPKHVCIHNLFSEQVARRPDYTAVICGTQKVSYQELHARANRLANRLRSLGVGPDVLVGICLERSEEIPVALLAVLKAGGAYVPLDPQYPRDRIAYMLEDSGASVLITNKQLEEQLLEGLPQVVPTVICMDRDADSLLEESAEQPSVDVGPANLAYVIYTSGSTGKPKGVQITHGSVVNFLFAMRRDLQFSDRERLLAVTTLSFDIAGLEFYLPLTTGATVVVAPREALADGATLAAMILDSGITVMQATPVTWRALLDSEWRGTPGLKILCGGEALPRELANRLCAMNGDVWNLYGPTETTIWSTIHRVTSGDGSVPIGRPIGNTQLYILDEQRALVPRGVPGELYIGGDGLARGYLHRAQLTSERFVPDPFHAGQKLYRTGDLVRWLPDGNVEYILRMDHQVKLRGFRIELGEIETALEQQPAVRQAVVMVREDTPDDQRLAAYLVLRDGFVRDAKSLREALALRLPDYMLPSQWVFLQAFPLTPNRKVDRRALPVPENTETKSAHFSPPCTESEIRVAEIWQALLKQNRVGVDDNFFDLGGHSLLVVQMQLSLRKRFDQKISLVELFQRPTVSAIASLLDARMAQQQLAEPVGAMRDKGAQFHE